MDKSGTKAKKSSFDGNGHFDRQSRWVVLYTVCATGFVIRWISTIKAIPPLTLGVVGIIGHMLPHTFGHPVLLDVLSSL